MAAQTQIAGWPVVAGVEPATGIERDALRVAKSPGEYLSSAAVGTQSEDLSTQVARVGGPRRDVALAGRRIEVSVRAQLEATAEVVAGAARNAVQQHLLIDQRIALDGETRNSIRVATRTCVGVIEEDVGRFDGNSQEPALAAAGCDDFQRKGRRREQLAMANDPNPSRTLREPDRAILRERERPGCDQALRDRVHREFERPG